MPFFKIAYYGICWLIYALIVLCLPILICKAKYRQSLPARFLLWRNPFPTKDIDFWFHACSLGEVTSLEPLLFALRDSGHAHNVLLSVITQTGHAKALKMQAACNGSNTQVYVSYLPFEVLLMFWVGNVKNLFVLEAELWFGLFDSAKLKNARTILLNARISSRSFPRYTRFAWLYRFIFSLIDSVLAQSEVDKTRLESLGANNVDVAGNLKALNIPTPKYIFHDSNPRPLVVLASTHKGEEQLLLESLRPLFAQNLANFRLLIAPRHPERFDSVWELLASYFPNLKHSRRSKDSDFLQADIILADSLGELVDFYAIASVVVLCGSFVPVGGHNPLEVAALNKPLLSGHAIFNQIPLFDLVKNAILIDINELADKLKDIANLPKTEIISKPDRDKFFTLLDI